MARKQRLAAQAKRIAAAGRNGDTALAHLSPDEITILNSIQGGESINPDTGLPEYFSIGKVLKGVAKAAGALAGAYVGGPAGAAIGGGITSALLGDDMSKSLTTGLLAGLGAYGAQSFGLGDQIGMETLGSGADLLGRTAAEGAASKGGGMGMSALLPMLGIGAAAATMGKAKQAKLPGDKPDTSKVPEYEELDREAMSYSADPYTYGIFSPEHVYFDEVNPNLKPKKMKYGGNVSEGGKKQGDKDRGGQGPKGGGDSGKGKAGTGFSDAGFANRANTGYRPDTSRSPVQGGGHTTMSSAAADRKIMDRYMDAPAEQITDDRSYWDAVRGLGIRGNDYENRGQGFADDPLGAIGRTLGGMFGVGEINPNSQALGRSINRPTADWGVDPLGAALGGLGLAGMGFGTGAAYYGIKGISGYPGPMVAFDSAAQPISQDESASGWHWSDNGAFAGMFDNPATGTGAGGWRGGGTGNSGLGRGHTITPPGIIRKPAPQTPTPPDENEEQPTGRTYNPLANPYTYGQFDPEHVFFEGMLPIQDLNMARGGTVPGAMHGGGQDDIIPAALAPGEHVIDAATVADIGDGNSDAGHKKIEAFKAEIRKHKRSAKPNTIPPRALGISQYLRRAA